MKILGRSDDSHESHRKYVVEMTWQEMSDLFGFADPYYYRGREATVPEVGKSYKIDGVFKAAKRALELAKQGRDAAQELLKSATDFLWFYEGDKKEVAE